MKGQPPLEHRRCEQVASEGDCRLVRRSIVGKFEAVLVLGVDVAASELEE